VNPEDKGYVEGKWRIIINGISAVESTEVIDAKVIELTDQVDDKINDAQDQLNDMIADAATELARATKAADDAAAEASAVVANKVADAQIGYFECNTAANTALKQTTLDYIGTGNDKSYYTIPAAGSNVKIKMQYTNTATGTVELQFGSNTATKKQLIYNGEPASNNNSWDDGEVISIYYDNTYNNGVGAYQASNARGGGGSKGMKELKGITVAYITNNGDTLGNVVSTGAEAPFYQYIKYPVNEGDVVMISGHGAAVARLWGIVGDNSVMIDKSASVADGNNLVLIMPEGARFITLNSTIASNPKWYYARKDSAGAEEIFMEAYLYGDLKTLAVGQLYYQGESVKTNDKQFFKVIKEILKMNDLDEVSIGDIRAITSGTYLGTYQALENVKTYTDTPYSENDYAIGRPAGAVINVTADSETISSLEEATSITVTIAGIELTVTVDSTMDAVGVAAAIFTAFGTQEEWKLTDNSDGTLTLISKVAKTSAPTISSSVGDTGITISFAENSTYAGSTKLSKYNGTTWETVSLNNYAADTAMWTSRDVIWLSTISNGVVQQNSAQNEFNAREGTSEYWDFAISDKKGNVICIIKDGHIITKNFKSSELRISVGDVTNAAYAVSDVNGNMAFAITEDGHIVTKNFNSRLVSLESIALLDKIITLVTKFIGKTMAVVGDSISTYTGYTPSNWRVYYPSGNVNNVSLTFWHIVATTLGMTALNCSYSASSVTGDSTQTEVSSSHAQGECAGCSDVRIASLTRDSNTPDIVLITLGTNDYGNGKGLGSWDEHSAIPSEGTIGNFSSAYALMLHKIKTALPNARIFCCTIFQRDFSFPTGTLSIRSYNDVIKKMADIFGCDVIDTYACGLNRYNIGSYSVDGTLHPNAAGHKLIAEKIITELIAKY
jgi:hypothetical protein